MSRPDVVLSAGFDQAEFARNIRKLETQVLAAEKRMRTSSANAIKADTAEQKFHFQNLNKFQAEQLAVHKAHLANMLQQQVAYNKKVEALAGASQPSAGGGGRRPPTIGGAGRGRMGGMGMGGFRGGMISAGFGLMGAGFPGARALSGLMIGEGFSGAAGVTGAAVAVGITAIAVATQKLIGLYRDLATAALEVGAGHEQAMRSIAAINDMAKTSMLPLLTKIQEQEQRIFDALLESRPEFDHLVGVFSALVLDSTKFAEQLLLAVTGAGNLEEAFKGLLEKSSKLIAFVGALAETSAVGQLTNPWAVYARYKVLMNEGAKAGNLPQPPTGINPNLAMQNRGSVSGLREEIFGVNTGQNRGAELKIENDIKAKQIELLRAEYEIDLKINALTLEKKMAENSLTQSQSTKVDDIMKEIEFEKKLTQIKLDSANKAVEIARTKMEGQGANMGRLTGTHHTQAEYEGARKKYLDATEEEAKAEKKRDDIIGDSKIKLHELVIKQMEAEVEEQKIWLNSKVADTEAEQARAAAIRETMRAIVDLNAVQRGATFDPGVQQVISSQFPEGASGQRQPLTPAGIQIMRRAALQYGQQRIQTRINTERQGRSTAESILENTTNPRDREVLVDSIMRSKAAEEELNAELRVTLGLLRDMTDPGTAKWDEWNSAIEETTGNIVKLQKKALTTGDMLRSTFELLVTHASQFSGVIGSTVGRVAILGRSILDLSKIKLADNVTEAGSISGGLKAGFATKGKALTEGIPMLAGIASAAISVIQTLHTLFIKAAKVMAENIGKEVDRLDSVANKTGRLNDAIVGIEAQRTKATTELSTKKGGQKELDKLLPQIDATLASIRERQKDIADSFKKDLTLLSTDEFTQQMTRTWDEITSKVNEYLKAVGDSPEAYATVIDYIEKSAARMNEALDKRRDEENDSWYKGAENLQGELISLDTEAAQKKIDAQKDYFDFVAKTEKERAALVKNNIKAEADDLEHLASLEKALIDLKEQEKKDILSIQNEGIAERQKTTLDDKNQRIATLQDQVKEQEIAYNKEIQHILEARDERRLAYDERMAQMTDEEQKAFENYENFVLRTDNEMDRSRKAHLERLNQIELERSGLLSMLDAETQAVIALRTAWVDGTTAATAAQILLNEQLQIELDYQQRLRDESTSAGDRPPTSATTNISLDLNINIPPGANVNPEAVRDIVREEFNAVVSRIPVRR